ncbi:hypothetical protein NA57DRAFT_35094 [Rhizodiscina lignyota]|uniref:Uncharacterized protein n=1 Tax=Rhizodiscina lignyota TaxID=1504668 RepID=A0A9P4MD67_9PEZI|nr:hypothetical protein NA57DRAFT_35094 [Rhizodiscina lignyota]
MAQLTLFVGRLEVFHSLHCLNRIRQSLHRDYYVNEHPFPPELLSEGHLDHCIEHLMQALQCHSDLTPMLWEKKGTDITLMRETLHTCRDFDKIHEWAFKRRLDFSAKTSLQDGSVRILD